MTPGSPRTTHPAAASLPKGGQEAARGGGKPKPSAAGCPWIYELPLDVTLRCERERHEDDRHRKASFHWPSDAAGARRLGQRREAAAD